MSEEPSKQVNWRVQLRTNGEKNEYRLFEHVSGRSFPIDDKEALIFSTTGMFPPRIKNQINDL